jgi:uncharacterized delta-60 repeat protein
MTKRGWLGAKLLLAATAAVADSGSAWLQYGPDRAGGLLFNITRDYTIDNRGAGLAVDAQGRLLVLADWLSNVANRDCALTRHLPLARHLDMDFTGPDGLEGTRRIAVDTGGPDADRCRGVVTDAWSRPLVYGSSTTDFIGGSTGFVLRLREDGSADTTFASAGRFLLGSQLGFLGVRSELRHAAVLPDRRVLACGWVERGGQRDMLILRLGTSGQFDASFAGNGRIEVDFEGADDVCARLALLPDGDVMAGGTAIDGGGVLGYGFVRLNADGSLDDGFSGDGLRHVTHGSVLAATPELNDLAWDATRQRLYAGATLQFAADQSYSAQLLALTSTGALDTGFDGDGRRIFRYSAITATPERSGGGSSLKRLLLNAQGAVYAIGTHDNSATDAPANGASDVATARFEPNGSLMTSGAGAFNGDGVALYNLSRLRHRDVSAAGSRQAEDVAVDALMHRDRLLLLLDRDRHPNGPKVPVIAAINDDRIGEDSFESVGLERPQLAVRPVISVPIGYGRYCSVRTPGNGGYGLLPAGSDPCATLTEGAPNAVIERAGLFSLTGTNWVIGTCSGGFITLRVGAGTAPFDAAFADAAGRSNCIFTAAPQNLPIFSRPYTGAHPVANTQSFNHDPYGIPIDVTDFGQPGSTYLACAVDFKGRHQSVGNPDVDGACSASNGIDEPAVDILVDRSRLAVAMAAGVVEMAVPRHVPNYTPSDMDPYQREVFVRHSVGSGTYAEEFTAFYAHMFDTRVRRGDVVQAGDVIGRVGTTGASSGDHLHLSVHRHRNLSWRRSFEFDFDQWDRDASVSSFDPWGWQAPAGVDPWAWRFRVHASDPVRNNAGSFSTRLWKSGEAPTLD